MFPFLGAAHLVTLGQLGSVLSSVHAQQLGQHQLILVRLEPDLGHTNIRLHLQIHNLTFLEVNYFKN